HTYTARMVKTAELLERELARRRAPHPHGQPDLARISYGYEQLGGSEVDRSLTEAWKSSELPAKQRALVDSELAAMYRGDPPAVFVSLAKILEPFVERNMPFLEIGCSSGYYYEVLEYLLKKPIRYTGVDYSEPMIR